MTSLHTIDTVVIGAGHAGLAVSRLLTAAGREHVVLDRGRVGERWRTSRWDSLRLLTPTWMTRLPGMARRRRPRRLPVRRSVRASARAVRRILRGTRRDRDDGGPGSPPDRPAPTTCPPTTARGVRARSCSPPVPTALRASRPPSVAPASRSSPATATATPTASRRAASWSSAPRPRECRSPTSSSGRAGTSSWQSGGTPGCPAAIAAWTSSGGWSPPAGSPARSTRCPTRGRASRAVAAAGRAPGRGRRGQTTSTWLRCSGAASG